VPDKGAAKVKFKSKLILIASGVVVVAAGVYANGYYSDRDTVVVQTGAVVRRNLASVVTSTGDIKPRNYINIGANAMGQIKEILVKEGEKVSKGQLLARIENTQAQADVESQRANLNSAEADAAAAEAGVNAADESLATAQAVIDRGNADLERLKSDFERAGDLLKEKLIARQEFEQKKAAYDGQVASVRESKARLAQSRAQRKQSAAQLASSQRRIAQARAGLNRVNDILGKYNAYAPLDGVVTNLPVRVGETVVPGIQNSSASLIMTIADMSVITAEVKVDETDIVNVRLGQPVEVMIDAMSSRSFSGQVTEIGNTAILRSTGQAASQSATSSQEAKDFKVVIAVENPPAEIRPGLSCTVKITTATRQSVLSIPIQALTVRQQVDLDTAANSAPPAADADADAEPEKGAEIQGVFVVSNGKAEFHKVQTGIAGATSIEVVDGLKQGDRIVTGTYQTLRTLRNGSAVKVAPKERKG
jgi:HlyD family secretion protein